MCNVSRTKSKASIAASALASFSSRAAGTLLEVEDFAGVHDVVGIENAFDALHQVDFGLRAGEAQEGFFSQADTMFRRNGPTMFHDGFKDQDINLTALFDEVLFAETLRT